jgi:hypothetical protein
MKTQSAPQEGHLNAFGRFHRILGHLTCPNLTGIFQDRADHRLPQSHCSTGSKPSVLPEQPKEFLRAFFGFVDSTHKMTSPAPFIIHGHGTKIDVLIHDMDLVPKQDPTTLAGTLPFLGLNIEDHDPTLGAIELKSVFTRELGSNSVHLGKLVSRVGEINHIVGIHQQGDTAASYHNAQAGFM